MSTRSGYWTSRICATMAMSFVGRSRLPRASARRFRLAVRRAARRILPTKDGQPSIQDTRWQQHAPFVSLGEQQATAAEFSLATLKHFEAADVVVRAHVDLRHAAARYAGIVARYQGPADKNMLLALVAQADVGFRAQIWQQRGVSWSCLKTAKLMRGQGTLELQAVGNEAIVSFEGQPLIRCPIPGPVEAGGVGLRAAGATIRMFTACAHSAAGDSRQRRCA